MSSLFSVIIAAYNAEDTIEAAILSNLPDGLAVECEVIVMDDGSTDGTLERAQRVQDGRVQVFSLDRNGGRAHARNAAIARARGDLIVPCDADDKSLPGRLESHLGAFARDRSLDVVFGKVRAVASDGSSRHWPVMPATPAGVDARFGRGRMAVAHGASAFRRSWFDSVGGYDAALPVAEDFDLFLRGPSPRKYAQHEEFVLEYNVATAFPRWEYWWENERYRRAIARRHADNSRGDIAPYLERQSTLSLRALEGIRWMSRRTHHAWRANTSQK